MTIGSLNNARKIVLQLALGLIETPAPHRAGQPAWQHLEPFIRTIEELIDRSNFGVCLHVHSNVKALTVARAQGNHLVMQQDGHLQVWAVVMIRVASALYTTPSTTRHPLAGLSNSLVNHQNALLYPLLN
jgi:hypothetical protein